jgi:chlorobactene glucosyltransferase
VLEPILTTIAWFFAGAAAIPLFLTAANLLVWPRGRRWPVNRPRDERPSVSILIPARNEVDSIERVVHAAASGHLAANEIIVCDDGSTDGTGRILQRLTDRLPELKVIQGAELPDGWIGKPYACHQLGEEASADILIYVDADTVFESQGIERILSLFEHYDADVVTAVPAQETQSFAERLMLPLLHLTYTSWFPLPLTWKSKDPRFLAANGQIMAFKREAYEEIGGFEAVRDDIVDDMAITRTAKENGRRVVFADGFRIATCRMYGGWKEVWEGFSKNLYPGIGARPTALVLVLGLYASAFLGAWLLLPVSVITGIALGPALLAVLFNVFTRLMLAIRFQHRLVSSVLLHPFSIIGFIAIALNSWRWTRRGLTSWSGRTYSIRTNDSAN